MASIIQVRVDDELKAKSDALFKELGTDTTTAVRMFLTKAVRESGFPFDISISSQRDIEKRLFKPLTMEDMLARLETSRQQVEYGDWVDGDDMVADLEKKYGI